MRITRAALITATEAVRLVEQGAYLVDIRGERSREEDGRVPSAVVVDRRQLDRRFGRDSPDLVPEAADPSRQVIVFCSSERGSGPIAERLARLGYPFVAHIEGGFAAWQDATLPTT
ncbi:rhodanese-like domain-containing protein [Pseudonocardia dioxanivorans]|jgi:rhodanese-related sulfurtransferase|uniref:rhodanese-like domain-containing protein n=1 Tax=Pseudonocardia dioxanivorans TaxID=240495 RepID=UPI00131A4DEE|nr:rhodanese-like domain-containing protein [Pseudonocardia dioxanivorans]